MAIPDYQTAMLPVLQCLRDGIEHRRPDIVRFVADHFQLTDAERKQLLPSGKMPVIRSRVSWALSYLKQAQVIAAPKRGVYRITPRGQELLSANPSRVDVDTLRQFPEFMEFIHRTSGKTRSSTDAPQQRPSEPSAEGGETPEEAIRQAYDALRNSVEAELLDAVRRSDWAFFERLVVEVLVKIGYGGSLEDAGQAIGQTGDEGVDGVIKEDRLGLDLIYVQAKKWENTVGRPEIQKFAGALQGKRAKKGCSSRLPTSPSRRWSMRRVSRRRSVSWTGRSWRR